MKEKIRFWLPIAAIIFSVISFSLSFWQSLQGAQSRIRPVLVFVWKEGGWYLHNVGSGPALDVVVAQSSNIKEWTSPVRTPPLGIEGDFHLEWLGACNVRALGVTYKDYEGREYTTKTWDDKERLYRGHTMDQWDPNKIKPWWNLASSETCDS